ncbi:hypothetical protein I4F81_000162 [Pyropia yezoensis]|uniref:Uncharacterized protein n=1 Tax=Pyropia yezoensis TaxID=2788 RepID=A0ACC3BI19_PYRYE|nr:hypothetical protein I4F81_000162 [Neopyropia yezoensis]
MPSPPPSPRPPRPLPTEEASHGVSDASGVPDDTGVPDAPGVPDARPSAAGGPSGRLPSPPPPPPLQHRTLTSLPDNVLGRITAAAYAAGGHAALFSASRRLSRVGPASLTTLTLRRPPHVRLGAATEAAVLDVLHTDLTVAEQGAAIRLFFDASQAFADAEERGHRFLRRAPNVQAVSLHGDDRSGSVCDACVVAAAASGGGGWVMPPAPGDRVEAIMDTVFAAQQMPALRALRLTTFSASATVLDALGSQPLTAAPLRGLHLRCIANPVWATVVAPLLGHHGGTLTELTLGGVPNECWPSESRVRRVVSAPAGGMPALRTLTLLAVTFGHRTAAAVAAACPGLTCLAVDGAIGQGASAAVDVQALPRLARLSWIAATEWAVDDDLGPLFAGRALDEAQGGGHFLLGEEPPLVDPVVSALVAATALPAELDVLTAGFFDDDNLRRLVDAATSVSRLARLRIAFDDTVTPAGMSALGRLPALTALSLHVTEERAGGLFHPWPCGRLTHLGVVPWVAVRPQVLTPLLLTSLGASPAASTLTSLALTIEPLEAALSAEPLRRLSRLRRIHYRLVDGDGVPYGRAADAVAAAAPMVRWMREQLPRLTAVPGVPSHWAGLA